jgi:dihydrofolate reductase/plastocyanin
MTPGATPPRRIRYQVAASLDGYIAGPDGDADWIVMDPDIDFGALFSQFDTFLMGRRTWEGMPGGTPMSGRVLVFSRTLRQEDHPGVTVVSDRVEETLRALRAEPGKDIWLFGGGELFRSLLELGQVDTVEVAVVPVMLGAGIPLLPGGERHSLALTAIRARPGTGERTRRRVMRWLPHGVAGLGAGGIAALALAMAILPGSETEVAASDAPPAVTVSMSTTRFSPGSVRVKAGGTVTWSNTSEIVHTVTSEDFNSGNIAVGGRYQRTFARPGTYSYWCVPHRQAGMVGTVVVEP